MKAIQYRAYGGFADCSRIESSMSDRIQITLAFAEKSPYQTMEMN
jgi:hypothetical protein